MRIITIMLLFILTSCGQDLSSLGRGNSGRGVSNTSNNALTCSCSTQEEYVCGSNGEVSVTFLNGCIAQCNGFNYTFGACDQGNQATAPACDVNIKDVCGRPACVDQSNCPPPGIYADQCSLVNSGATQLDISECTSGTNP